MNKEEKKYYCRYIEDGGRELLFFKDFNNFYIFPPTKILLISKKLYSNNSEELEKLICTFNKYRNIIIDIIKIQESKKYILYTSSIIEKIFNIDDINSINFSEIKYFTRLENRIGEKYLNKIKRLLTFSKIQDKLHRIKVTLFRPIKLTFSLTINQREILFSSFNFDIFYKNSISSDCFINDILSLKYSEDIRIDFIISYLVGHNLFNLFYTQLQKEIIRILI